MKENQQDGFAIMTLHEPTVQSSSNFKKPLCKGNYTASKTQQAQIPFCFFTSTTRGPCERNINSSVKQENIAGNYSSKKES